MRTRSAFWQSRTRAWELLGHPRVAIGAVAVAQIATILISWPLWQARTTPPNIGVLGFLEGVPLGVALLVTAVAAVVWPRWGSVSHVVVVAAALLGDRFRWLPEVVSLSILLVAFGWGPAGRMVGRAHVASLWIWAGLHKALSVGWERGSARFITDAVHLDALPGLVLYGLPLVEISLGAMALVPRLRRFVIGPAILLHVGIVVALFGERHNAVVWPWNLALAVSVIALFRDRAEDREVGRRKAVAAAVNAAFLVAPLGFYAGVVDTYLAHNLYSDNGASVRWCDASGTCSSAPITEARQRFRSPLPPEPDLYEDWFRRVCEPGDQLVIEVPETRIPRLDAGTTSVTCPRP